MTDTIKQVEGDAVVKTLDRRESAQALTPQCFRYELLRKAYEQADVSDPSLTDESSLVERLGHKVRLLKEAREILRSRRPQIWYC